MEEKQTEHGCFNVSIINEEFYMPQLDRTRRIWIYKPVGYDNDMERRYPVIYMHDGQNLFDDATAFGEEWGVDEVLNGMYASCIIIGIDNSERRMTEYNFRDHEEHGEGEGKKYIEFIVQTLKPFIDEHYRTQPEREHTYIAGSSMGGLISLYGALYFAETFGGAGIFSPALWLVPDAIDELKIIAEQNTQHPQRIFFYGGAKEDCDMLLHITNVEQMLKEHAHYKVELIVDPEGDHSEYRWRNVFPFYYNWLTS